MPELLLSPIFYACAWVGCGLVKSTIDLCRKAELDLMQIGHDLAFGPISLVTELVQLSVIGMSVRYRADVEVESRSSEGAGLRVDEAILQEAIEETKKIGESVEELAEEREKASL